MNLDERMAQVYPVGTALALRIAEGLDERRLAHSVAGRNGHAQPRLRGAAEEARLTRRLREIREMP